MLARLSPTARCVCLAQHNSYTHVCLSCLERTRDLVQATERHGGLWGPKDRAAQLCPCRQTVRHRARYHRFACILVLHGLSAHLCPKCFSFLRYCHPFQHGQRPVCEAALLFCRDDRWERRSDINIPWFEEDCEQNLAEFSTPSKQLYFAQNFLWREWAQLRKPQQRNF